MPVADRVDELAAAFGQSVADFATDHLLPLLDGLTDEAARALQERIDHLRGKKPKAK